MTHLFPVEPAPEDDEPYFEDLPDDAVSEAQARSSMFGREFDAEAFAFVESCGGRIVEAPVVVHGYRLDALVEGVNGWRCLIAAHGTPDRTDRPQAGMRRTDTMLKFGFKALRLEQRRCELPVILVTSHLPVPGSKSAYYLSELNDSVWDAVATVGDLDGRQRMRHYLGQAGPPPAPLPAPWREVQLSLDDVDPFGDDDDA